MTVAVEAQRLKALETTIERGMSTFIEVGRALTEIRDGKLYKHDYSTFETYCQQRWGMGRQRAYELIAASDAAVNVRNSVQIKNAEQAVALAKAPKDKRAQAWDRATEIAEERGEKVTARVVTEAVESIADISEYPPSRLRRPDMKEISGYVAEARKALRALVRLTEGMVCQGRFKTAGELVQMANEDYKQEAA